jgi:hypothetical protein
VGPLAIRRDDDRVIIRRDNLTLRFHASCAFSNVLLTHEDGVHELHEALRAVEEELPIGSPPDDIEVFNLGEEERERTLSLISPLNQLNRNSD